MDVKFREASDEDYCHIKELSEGIYENSDTLLYSFLDWLENDEWFLFVGELSEYRPIAFTAVQVTDGMMGLNVRCSRVDKEYRGRGLFKAIVRYAVRYVRERVPNARYIYRIQVADIRVPGGYEILKETEAVTVVLNGSTTKCMEGSVAKSYVRNMTWTEFKALYDSKDVVKDMFYSSTLEIDCDVYNLACLANWDALKKRKRIRIMFTEDKGGDGNPETVISFLRLEKFFTTEGTFMAAMNLYGLKEDALKCHIAKGLLETSKHVGGEKCLLMLWMAREAVPACVKFLRESCGPSGCDIDYWDKMNVLRGNFCNELEDV